MCFKYDASWIIQVLGHRVGFQHRPCNRCRRSFPSVGWCSSRGHGSPGLLELGRSCRWQMVFYPQNRVSATGSFDSWAHARWRWLRALRSACRSPNGRLLAWLDCHIIIIDAVGNRLIVLLLVQRWYGWNVFDPNNSPHVALRRLNYGGSSSLPSVAKVIKIQSVALQ